MSELTDGLHIEIAYSVHAWRKSDLNLVNVEIPDYQRKIITTSSIQRQVCQPITETPFLLH